MEAAVIVDTLWVILAAVLVFFMNLGFGCVETGFCRSKNAVNILSKNFMVFAAASLAFYILGWGVMFGDGNGFMGLKGLIGLAGPDTSPAGDDTYQGVYGSIAWATVPLLAKFFFQLVFAGTAATIVSGCVAERVKYFAFVAFTFILVGLVYPIVGHWIWGGGWLGSAGFLDFAGSTQVHSIGGWAGLAGILALGPRYGKYNKNGTVNAIPGHNLPLAVIGVFILWLGWFGFNPGSTMSFQDPGLVALICVTTNMAAAAAMLSATIVSTMMLGKPDLGMTINGCLAGLVAITAPCAFVSVPSAIIIGGIAGVIVVLAVIGFDRLKIDDPVGALAVHLANGIWGTLAVGLFATEELAGTAGLFTGGGLGLLGIQFKGVIAVGLFVTGISYAAWSLLKVTMGIRVSIQEEIEGLDIGEHGNVAYPEFVSRKPWHSYVAIAEKTTE